MEDSIFTKIIKGDIPSHKVYEDAQTFAFLDIHPITEGHILVISKQQVDQFFDLPTEAYDALFETVQKAAKRIKEVFHPKRVCVRIEGFDVPHTHVHVYPCNTVDDFYGDRGRMSIEPDHPALAELAKRLQF